MIRVDCVNGMLYQGDTVIATDKTTPYCGLVGCVEKILSPRAAEHLSGSAEADVMVRFEDSGYAPSREKQVEEAFFSASGIRRSIGEIPMQYVPMGPGELINITAAQSSDVQLLKTDIDLFNAICRVFTRQTGD